MWPVFHIFLVEVYYYFAITSYLDLGIELLEIEYKILMISKNEITS